jgi:hypothetical protein
MWTLIEPYFYFYLAGCICYALLLPAKMIILYFLCWITKDNILIRNIKKINPPDEKYTFKTRLVVYGMFIAVDVTLSWINVAIVLWQIAVELFSVLRHFFTSVPEEIKLLRFPLKNNPHMPRESVWAHMTALSVKLGELIPMDSTLIQSLDDVHGNYQSFGRISALKQLDNLNIISSETISSALKQLQSADEY